jgi:CHASE1-domain containing sensor protein
MQDGGFNCNSNTIGAEHSSMHSTISVIEGILEYAQNGYQYRLEELQEAGDKSRTFLLQHRLFRSDRTGKIIDKKMIMLSFPSRWRYDILRALDYFQFAGIEYDPRMQDALDILKLKRRKDNIWPVQAKHPGQTHFDMEVTGGPSRWNTLRALRVLKQFGETE